MKGGNFVNFTFFKEVEDLEGVSSRHSMRQFKKRDCHGFPSGSLAMTILTLSLRGAKRRSNLKERLPRAPEGSPCNNNSSAVIARSEATKQSQKEIATPLACRRLAIGGGLLCQVIAGLQ